MSTVTNCQEVISDICDLIQLDHDAIAAYQSAIERLDNAAYKKKFNAFLNDHKRHVEELSAAVRIEGGDPPGKGDAMKILTKGKVVIADLFGDDAILKAMSVNEAVTNTKYEAAVETVYAEHIQELLFRGLSDERRHKEWIATTLDNH